MLRPHGVNECVIEFPQLSSSTSVGDLLDRRKQRSGGVPTGLSDKEQAAVGATAA